MTTGNPYTANLSHEPFNEASKPDETRTARLNLLHVCESDRKNKFSEAKEISERLGMTAEQVKMLI